MIEMSFMEESLDVPLRHVLEVIQQRTLHQSTYFGIRAIKSPLDVWVYQEILFEQRPGVIVEIGNFHGGSTLALAHLCDALGCGRVIGVDVSHANVDERARSHPRVTLIEGDACEVFGEVRGQVGPEERVLVIEDSSHTFENTLAVLRTYQALVHPGGYFIVEDGIMHHGLEGGPSPGPFEAIEAFVAENPAFDIDRGRESFLITWNPKGFLRRVGA